MKPPSFAAFAAARAASSNHARTAAASSAEAFAEDAVHRAQLVEDLHTGRGALLRLEAPEGVLVLPRIGGRLARDLARQVAVVTALAGPEHGLQRRRRLLDRLDRAARIGE